jgi:Flp pilus assembly protein TadD
MMMFAYPKIGLSLVALALAGTALPAYAQDEDEFVSTGGVLPAGMVQSLDPADRLAMNLRLLSQNPRDVNALTQAGTSALEVGDPNAAVGFLARAETLSPNNGRVKSALGSALVQLERPTEAMRFFNEAVAYGVPERDVWKDRGLAYDLSGDPRRAQRDYELALRNGQDAETTRRLALSLGAMGEKDQALRLLEPLVRRNDQGAWRARAFVLAMNGDIKGAERIVEQVMPSGSLSPFLRRLPTLSAAQRARAVNFGTMPTDGILYAAAPSVGPARPISGAASSALASVTPPVSQRFESKSDLLARKPDKRRRPGKADQVALAAPLATTPLRSASAASNPTSRPVAPGFSSSGFSNPESSSSVTSSSRAPNGTQPPTELASSSPSDRRVGKRIGPVDAERMPDFLKPGASAPQTVRVVGNILPPPSGNAPTSSVLLTETSRPPAQVAVLAARPTTPTLAPAPKPPVTADLSPISAASTQPIAARVEQPSAAVFEVAAARPLPAPVLPAPVLPTAGSPALTPAVKVVDMAPATGPAPNFPPPSAFPPPSVTPAFVKPADTALPPAPTLPPAALPSPALGVTPEVKTAGISTEAAPAGPSVTPTPPIVAAPAPSVPAILAPSVASTLPPAPVPVGAVTQISAPQPTNVPAKISGPTSTEAGIATLFGQPLPPSNSAILADQSPPIVTPLANNQLTPATPEPVVAAAAEAPKPALEPVGLASVLEGITPEEESRAGPVLTDTEFRRARIAAKRKADEEALAATGAAAKEDAAEKAKREEEEERKRVAAQNPARVWVQIATGANKSGLPITWKRIRETAPEALKGAAAWYAPYKSTNRLLVGPYKGQNEARSLVNKLSAKGVATTTYTSDAGQEISRLSSR